MKSFKSLSHKEKMEYIGILAIYPLILLYEQIGKSFKFLNSKSRQITASILTVCLMLTMIPLSAMTAFAAADTWDGSVASSYAGGDGTVNDPYKISNGAQLAYLAKYITDNLHEYEGEYFVLTNDIDLNDREWTTIGVSNWQFCGTFDGAGHTISGLYINDTEGKGHQGLFGGVGEGGVVKNLHVIGEVYSTDGPVGGVAASCVKSTIDGCSFEGTLQCGDRAFAGGIVGSCTFSTVMNCYNKGTVIGGTDNRNTRVGGIVGNMAGYSSVGPANVFNCYNIGSVSNNFIAGGIVGYNERGTVSNCYNIGTVNGGSSSGGVVGGNYDGTVSHCYWLENGSSIEGGTVESCDSFESVSDTVSYNGDEVVLSSALNKWIAAQTDASAYKTWGVYQEENNGYPVFKKPHTHTGVEGDFEEWTAKSGKVSTSGKYYLADNITATGNITIASGAEVTLCLNGYTLDLGSKKITVSSGASLSICDCSEGESGVIKSTHSAALDSSDRYSDTAGAINVFGNATISSGTVQNDCQYGCAIYVGKNANLTVSGGKVAITNNGHYAVYVGNNTLFGTDPAGTFTMTGGVIDTGTGYGSGVGVCICNGAVATVTGGKIQSYGGSNAIMNYNSTLIIGGDAVINNTGEYSAVWINASTGDATTELHISGGTITAPNAEAAVGIANGNGDTVVYLSGNPTITGKDSDISIAVKMDGTIKPKFYAVSEDGNTAYSGEALRLYLDGAHRAQSGVVVVRNSTDTEKFTLTNGGYKLEQSGENLAIATYGYNLWVDGVYVTEDNTSDILDNGTASYNAETQTLYLENAVISGSYTPEDLDYAAGIYSSHALNIVISGTVNIHVENSNYGMGILVDGDLNIAKGPDNSSVTLNVIGDFAAAGCLDGGNITYDGLTVKGSAEIDTQNAPTEEVALSDGIFFAGSNIAKMLQFTYTAPHTHSWSTEWTTDGTHHWHKCENADCTVTENSQKDGYATHKTSGLCDCGGVVINETNFPDANFRTYLTDTLGKGGDDGFFTADELAEIKDIDVDSKKISNLKGIEHFTYLTALSCSSNQLTALDVSNNTALEKLYCYNNSIAGLDLSNNTSLKNLACYGNKITSLDVSSLNKLESLLCNTCNLTSLDLSNNTKISSFNGRTQTASIEIDQKTMTFDMSTLDSNFDGSKATVTTEGCSFNGSILTVKEGVSKVEYTYATGLEENTITVTLTVTNPHTHIVEDNDSNCLTAVVCTCGKETVAARDEHTSTGNNVATYTKKAICDVCSTEYGDVVPDDKKPEGEIKIYGNWWREFVNTITFGIFCKDTQTVDITTSDVGLGVEKAEYFITETVYTDANAVLTDSNISWNTLTIDGNGKASFNIEPNAKVIVYLKITDKAGNVTVIRSNGIVLDNIAPVISGITDGKTYCGAVEVTVSDTYFDKVTVGGNEATVEGGKFTVSPATGTQEIIAYDKAGNTTTYTITVNDGHTHTYGDSTEDTIVEKCQYCDFSASAQIKKPTGELVYNGGAHNSEVVYTGTLSCGNNLEISYGTATDTIGAGDYTASITLGGKTASVSYRVEKKKVTPPTINSKVYTGETLTADVSETALYTVTTNAGGKNVAVYDVVLTLKDGDNYKWDATEGVDGDKITLKFNITKATNEWTENPAMAGWTYGETVKEPTGKAKFIEGNYGIAYYDKDKNPIGNPSDAGDYFAQIFVADTTNFTGLTSEYLPFTIKKADLTITANPHTITYGDAPTNDGVEYSGFVNGEGKYVLDGTLSYDYSYAQYDDIGDNFTITPKGLTAANYEITFVPGKLTVNARPLVIGDFTAITNGHIYKGIAIEPAVSTTNSLVSATDYTVAYENNVNAGENTAKITITGKNNASGSVDIYFSIGKADPIITWPNALVGNAGDKLSTVALESGFTWDNADTVIVYSDNNYGMTYTPADTDNYNILKKDIKVNGLDVTFTTGEITLKDNKWSEFGNNLTFGMFFKETQSITITAADTESGVKEIAYYLATEELSIDDVKALESSKWTVYTDAFNVEPDNKYVVYARITDNAGNVIYINSDGIVLDSIKPVIAGVEDGKDVYGDAIFMVDEEYLDTVTLDGEPIEVKDGKYSVPADNKEHTIVVTDKTGNQVTYKLTVYKNYKVSFVVDGKEISSGEVGYGNDATLPEIPAKDGYTAKWDVDGKNITADTVITAVYEKIPESPKTGDNTNIWLWVAVMFVSGLSLFGIVVAKKRKEQEAE